jgi:hypothetical protein
LLVDLVFDAALERVPVEILFFVAGARVAAVAALAGGTEGCVRLAASRAATALLACVTSRWPAAAADVPAFTATSGARWATLRANAGVCSATLRATEGPCLATASAAWRATFGACETIDFATGTVFSATFLATFGA